jgi:gas vesicle protein
LKKTLYPRYCPNLLCQPEANLKAENERLKETAKIAIQEIGAWSRKAGKLEAENERLKKTIREQGEQVQHLADNLKEARDENERLKAALPATRCT